MAASIEARKSRGGRFELQAELARGGMGIVHRAVDRASGRAVALKRLIPDAKPQVAALFEREFYVLSSLKHPTIVEVFDYGIDEEGPFYTMELLAGRDLREVAPLDPKTACRYLRDIASSLALLHARRLLHRDVSPRNVRIVEEGRCKLLDFGALMAFGIPQDIVGTPPSIAPEALSGQPLDQRADLYSLGALGYWMLTRRHAYPARHVSDLAEAWRTAPMPPSAFNQEVPADLEQLVHNLLSTDVLARPPSAAAVIDRLTVIGDLPPDHDRRTREAYLVGAHLVEREHETERIRRRIHRANTKTGSAVFVDGDPGVGKTRFLAEASLTARLAGMTVLSVDAKDHQGALSTIRALVQQLCELVPGARSALAPHDDVVQTVWPGFETGAKDPASREVSTARALAALPAIIETCLVETTEKRPLAIVVDNADHADPETAGILIAIARRIRRHALVLILSATAQPVVELSAATKALRDACAAFRLRDLTEFGVEQLVRSAFGDVPHVKRSAKRLFEASAGNPEHCMRVIQHWVDSQVVVYSGGTWVLPIELPRGALPEGSRVMLERLTRSGASARSLAESLSIIDRAVPHDLCIALSSSDRPTAVADIEELLQSEILVVTSAGYRFRHAALQHALAESLPAERRAELHAKTGALLLDRQPELEDRIVAGLHLILGGHDDRGADVVAAAARDALDAQGDTARLLARTRSALEAALAVYRRRGAGNVALLDLLVPLVVGSTDVSYEFAMQYGDETIERLRRALGLDALADGSEPTLEAVGAALASAPRFDETETPADNPPDAVTLINWLVRCVFTLVTVCSAAIDHESQTRFISALAPFRVFGPHHPATAAQDYCRLIVRLTEDRFTLARTEWLRLLERANELPFPPSLQRRLRVGMLYSLGVLESQLDDDTALERLAEIERVTSSQGGAVANQLRFLYHGFRGEIQLAEQCRERVEAFAIARGSAWQIEIWSTCTLSAVYGNTRDSAGNKRVVEQLERLKQRAPSLTLYWERAVATQYLLTGDPARAAELFEHTFERSAPRERVGWSCTRGALATACNQLGQHERAKRICTETIALADEDWPFVAMNLILYLELCLAHAGLGEIQEAKALLDELFERHRRAQNPMTLGSLHRTAALVARAENDAEAFERHLSEMDRWFRSTQNPSLIAQCDELRRTEAAAPTGFTQVGNLGGFAVTSAASMAQSVLSECRGSDERKQRALELVAEKACVKEAWLFTLDRSAEPVVAGRLGIAEPDQELVEQVRALFDDYSNESEETSLMSTSDSVSSVPFVPHAPRYQLFPLAVMRGARPLLVGAIATRAAGLVSTVHTRLLSEVASQLYQAGDIGPARLVG